MSTYVTQITNETKSIASSTLGVEYKELRFVFDVAKNDIRSAEKAYGVRPLSAVTAESVTRFYTLDHEFELVLTDTIGRSDDDTQRQDAINIMYDKADEIFKAMIHTKINLASFVLNVTSPSMSEPEIINDNKFVILRMQYNVKYRSALTL